MTAPNKRSSLATVFLVVLIDLMGFGIVLPLLPYYASDFNASPITVGLLYSVYSLSQLIFSPLWGAWSDKVGRRPIMLLSTFGAALSYLLFSFSHSLTLLFLSRILAGVMGGNISTAQAYVADVTTHENRAKGMGMIGAAFGIGFVIGPALSSALIHPSVSSHLPLGGLSAYAAPGLFASCLSLISFCMVVFLLPESLNTKAANDPTRIRRAGLFSASFWKFLQPKQGTILPSLLFCGIFLAAGQSSLYSAFPLFCKKILHLKPENVGLLFVWMGVVAVLVQGGLIHRLVKKYGEKKLFFLGNILLVIGLVLVGFSHDKMQLMGALFVMGLGGSLNGPTLTSLISKTAPPSETGAVLGSAQGLSALGRVIGPAWGGWLFSLSPKAPFLLTALVLCVTIVVGWQLQEAVAS